VEYLLDNTLVYKTCNECIKVILRRLCVCVCVFFGEYDLCIIGVVLSEIVVQNIISVDVCMGCP